MKPFHNGNHPGYCNSWCLSLWGLSSLILPKPMVRYVCFYREYLWRAPTRYQLERKACMIENTNNSPQKNIYGEAFKRIPKLFSENMNDEACMRENAQNIIKNYGWLDRYACMMGIPLESTHVQSQCSILRACIHFFNASFFQNHNK